MKNRRTKATGISTSTVIKVTERDSWTCIFCERDYEMNGPGFEIGRTVKDVMHYIPRSRGGRGIEQNLAIGCRYHHMMLDNGNNGRREEMLKIFREYLRRMYRGWDEEKLIYRKGENDA